MGNTIPPVADTNDFSDNPEFLFFQSLSISSLDSILNPVEPAGDSLVIKRKKDRYEDGNDASEDSGDDSESENHLYFPLSMNSPTFYSSQEDDPSSSFSMEKLNYKHYYNFYTKIYNKEKKVITWREYYLIFSKLKEIMNKKKMFANKKLWHPSTFNYSMKKAKDDEENYIKRGSVKYKDEKDILRMISKSKSKSKDEIEIEDKLEEKAVEAVLDGAMTEDPSLQEDKTNQLIENFITNILSEKRSTRFAKHQDFEELKDDPIQEEEEADVNQEENDLIPDYFTENVPSEHSEYTDMNDDISPLVSMTKSSANTTSNLTSIPYNPSVYSPIFFGYSLETFEKEKQKQKEIEKKNKAKISRAILNSKKVKIINLSNIENNLLKQINLRESKINKLKDTYETELARLSQEYESFVMSFTKNSMDDDPKDGKDKKKKNKKKDEEAELNNQRLIFLKQEKYNRDVDQLKTTFNIEYNEMSLINKEKNRKDLALISQKYKELEHFFFFDYFFIPFFNLIENLSKVEITKNISIVGNHLSQLKLVQADLNLLREEKKKILTEVNILESKKNDISSKDDKALQEKLSYLPKFAKKLTELKSMINVTETTLNQGIKQTKESVLNLYDSEAFLKKSLEIKLYEESLLPLFLKLSRSKKTRIHTSAIYGSQMSTDGRTSPSGDQTSFNIENILLCDRELLLVSLVLITHGNFDLKINTLIAIVSRNYFNNTTTGSDSSHSPMSPLSTSLITKRFFSLNFLLKFIEIIYDVLKELNFISSLILWEEIENLVFRIFYSYQFNLNIFLITEYELKLIIFHLINRNKLLLKIFGLIPSNSSSNRSSPNENSSSSSFASSQLLSLSVYQLSHLNPLSLLMKGQTSYNSTLKFIHFNQLKYYKQLNNVNKKIIHDLSMNLSPSSASSAFASTPSPTFINYLNFFNKNNKENFTSSFSNSSSSFFLSYFNLEPYINLRARKKKEKENKLIKIQSVIRTYLVQVNLRKLNLLNNLVNTKNKIIKEIKDKIIKKYKKNEEELNGIQKLKWNSILKLKQNELKLMQGLNLNRNDVLVYLIEEEIMKKKLLVEEKFNTIKTKYNINSFSLLTSYSNSDASNPSQVFNFGQISSRYPSVFTLYNEMSQLELSKLYDISLTHFNINTDENEDDQEDEEIDSLEEKSEEEEKEEEKEDEKEKAEEDDENEDDEENEENEEEEKEEREDDKKMTLSFFNSFVNSTRIPYQFPFEILETFFINSYSTDLIEFNSFNPLNSSSFSSLIFSHLQNFISNHILNQNQSLTNLTSKLNSLSPNAQLSSIPLTNLKGETFLETNLRLYLMKPEVKSSSEFLNRVMLSSNFLTKHKGERLLKIFSSKKLLLKYLSNNSNKKIILNLSSFFQFEKSKNKNFNLEKENEENLLKNSFLPSFPLTPSRLDQWNVLVETGSAELAGLVLPTRFAQSSTSPNLLYSTSSSAMIGLTNPQETVYSPRLSSNLFHILSSLRQIELSDLEFGVLKKFGYNLQFKLENFLIQQSNQSLRTLKNKFENMISSRVLQVNNLREEEEEEKKKNNRNEAEENPNRKRIGNDDKETEENTTEKLEQDKIEEIIANNELKKLNNNYLFYSKQYKNSMEKIKKEESNLNNVLISLNNTQEMFLAATQCSSLIKNYSSSFPSLVPVNYRMNWSQRLENLTNYLYSGNFSSCLEIIQLIESFEDSAKSLSKILINELYLKEHLKSVKTVIDPTIATNTSSSPVTSSVPLSSSSDSSATSKFTEFLDGNNLFSGKGLGRFEDIELDEIIDEELRNQENENDNGEEKREKSKWYESNNIYFYVSVDYDGVYHGNDELAGKLANKERLASEFLSSSRIPNLNSTLMCTIDYFGYKILAISKIPILHSKLNEDGVVVRNFNELTHGLTAHGKKFINKNKNNDDTRTILSHISDKFKLKTNFMKGKLDEEVSETPSINLNVFKGTNNSYYLRNYRAMLVPEVNIEDYEEEKIILVNNKKNYDREERKRRKELEKNKDEKSDEKILEEIETDSENEDGDLLQFEGKNNYLIVEILDSRRILNIKLTNKHRLKFKKKLTNINSYLRLFFKKNKSNVDDYEPVFKKIVYINKNNELEEVTLVKIKKFYLSKDIHNQNYFWKTLRPEYTTNYSEKLSIDIDINLVQDLYDFYDKKNKRLQATSEQSGVEKYKGNNNLYSFNSPYSKFSHAFTPPSNYQNQHKIELDKLINATSNLYINILPNYLLKLVQNKYIQEPFLNLLTNNFSLSKDMHRHGLNIRHIGYLRAICWKELPGNFQAFTNEKYIKSDKDLSEEIINGDYLMIENEMYQVFELEKRENSLDVDKKYKEKINKNRTPDYVTHNTIPISRYYKGKSKKNIRVFSGRISAIYINCDSVRLLLLGEMVARTVKQLIRSQLRDYLRLNKTISNNFFHNLVCNHLNLLTSSSPSLNSIEYYEEILFLSIRDRFGEYALLNSERKSFQKQTSSILKFIILRLVSMLNIKLSTTCLVNMDDASSFNSYSANFSSFNSSCLGFYFSPDDILDIQPVVKNNCPVYLFAKAMLVLKEAEDLYNKNYYNTVINDKPLLFYMFNERNGTKSIKNYGVLNKKYEGKIIGNYELELEGPIHYNTNIRSIYLNNSNELIEESLQAQNTDFDFIQPTISFIEVNSDSTLIPNNIDNHFSCEIFFSISSGKNTNRSIISSSRYQLLINRDEYITIILYDDFHALNIPLEMISEEVYENNSMSNYHNHQSSHSNKIWYHVIITFNGTIIKGFVNGQLKCEIETEQAFRKKKDQWNKKNALELKKLLEEEKKEEKKLTHKTFQEASIYFQKKNGIAELKKMAQIILDTEENIEEDIKEEKEHEKEAKKNKKSHFRDDRNDEIDLEDNSDQVITNRDKKMYALKKAKENYIKILYDKNLLELRHKYNLLKEDIKIRNERIISEGKLKNKNNHLRVGSLLPNSNNKYGHQFFNGEFSSMSLYSYCLTDNQVHFHFIHAIRSYFKDTDRLYSLASNKFYKAIINVSNNMELYQNYLQFYAKGLCHWCDSVLSSLPTKSKKNFYQKSVSNQQYSDFAYQKNEINSETLLTYQNDMKNKLIAASSELKNIIKHFEKLNILEPLLEIIKEMPPNPLLASIFVDIILIIKRKDKKIFNKSLTINKKILVNLPFQYGLTSPNLSSKYYEAAAFLFQVVLNDPALNFSYGDINLSFIKEIKSPQLIIYLILHSYYDKQLKVLEFSSFFSDYSNNLPSNLGSILPLNSSSFVNEELKFNRNYFSTINSSNYSSYNLYDSVILSPLLTPVPIPSSNFTKISYKFINNFSFSYFNYKSLLKNHEGIYINLFPYDDNSNDNDPFDSKPKEEKKLNKLNDENLNYKIIERDNPDINSSTYSSSELLLDDQDLDALARNLPQIEGIDLRNCTKVTNQGLKSLVKLKKLKKMILDNLYEINDEGILSVIKDLAPYLELISFSNLLLITNQSLFAISQHCSNLVSVNLSNCPLISLDYVNLIIENNDGLKHLYLSNISTQSEIYPARESNMKNSSATVNSILSSNQDNLYYSPSNQLHVVNSIPIPSNDNKERVLEIYEPIVSLNKSEENLIKFSKLLYGYNIEVLDLSNLNYLSDVTLIYLTKSIKSSIKVLNLNNLPYVSSYGINFVIKSCLKLEWINLSNNSLITSDAFGDHFTGNEEMKKTYKDIEEKYDEELRKKESLQQPNSFNINNNTDIVSPHIDNIMNSYQKGNEVHDDPSILSDSLNSLQQPSFSMNSSMVSLNSNSYLLKSSYNLLNMMVNIEYLNVTNCDLLNDEFCYHLSYKCFRIKYLILRGCSNITDVGISYFYSTPNINNQSFFMGFPPDSNSESNINPSFCNSLIHIDLSFLTSLTSKNLLNFLRFCANLESLELTGLATIVTDEFINYLCQFNSKKIKKLILNHNKQINNLSLFYISKYFASLEHLEIVDCPKINNNGLEIFGKENKSLKYLNLLRLPLITKKTIFFIKKINPNIIIRCDEEIFQKYD